MDTSNKHEEFEIMKQTSKETGFPISRLLDLKKRGYSIVKDEKHNAI